jgi:hypothetical protein
MAVAGGPVERDAIRDLILPAVAAAGWAEGQIVRASHLAASPEPRKRSVVSPRQNRSMEGVAMAGLSRAIV